MLQLESNVKKKPSSFVDVLRVRGCHWRLFCLLFHLVLIRYLVISKIFLNGFFFGAQNDKLDSHQLVVMLELVCDTWFRRFNGNGRNLH